MAIINPNKLINDIGVDKLNLNADKYYQNININSISSKPFSLPDAQHLFAEVSHLISGLSVLPEDNILDFGCGVGWLSRFIFSMGCNVHGIDVSQTAISRAKSLSSGWIKYFTNNCGVTSKLSYEHFDGHKIDFESNYFDHIVILDAFHHVPNQENILAEFYRVLKPGGKIGFCEPGPSHSESSSAQLEMSLHNVLENDIDINKIWEKSKKVGFTKIELFLSPLIGKLVSIDDYLNFPSNHETSSNYLSEIKWRSVNYPIFFLSKAGRKLSDSRRSDNLCAEITLEKFKSSYVCKSNENLFLNLIAVNKGSSVWLPSGSTNGSVNIGIVVTEKNKKTRNYRASLSETKTLPDDHVKSTFEIPKLHNGVYQIEINLVSEYVCWFSESGCESINFELHVL